MFSCLAAIPRGLLHRLKPWFLQSAALSSGYEEQDPIFKDQRCRCPKPSRRTHISHSQAGGRNRGRKQGWHEEGKREVPTGGMNGTITLKNPEKRYCLSGSHPLLPLQYLCSQLIPSLYFPFPTSPLSAHPTAPSEPQLPHLRGFHCFTCCMICPGRAGTRMWVGDRGNLLVAAVVIVHIFHQ